MTNNLFRPRSCLLWDRADNPVFPWNANTMFWRPCLLMVMIATGISHALFAQNAEVDVRIEAQKAIPIAISGFSQEVERVLEFDLFVVGFEAVKNGNAQFQLTAVPGAELAASLRDGTTGRELFRRAYPEGTLRAQAHTLSDHVVQAVLPQQKPIGRTKIAFCMDQGRDAEVMVADFDGANALPMTDDKTLVKSPSWAPGRMVLFYTSWRLGNPDIYLHDLSTGTRSLIARYSGSNLSPALAPDGTRLAMILSKSGSPDLWVGDAGGSNLRRLTSSKEDESSPCWSPNGRTLCFTSRMGGRPALYTIPASGGKPVPLATGGVSNGTEPDWSPDGKWIAFTRQSGGAFQICVVTARGGDARIIREGEDPTWSPNSRTLAFVRRVNGRRALSLLDVPTNRVKDLNLISGSCSQPSWAR